MEVAASSVAVEFKSLGFAELSLSTLTKDAAEEEEEEEEDDEPVWVGRVIHDKYTSGILCAPPPQQG